MRLIAAILGFAASVLGVLGTAEVVAAPPSAATVYSYDVPHYAAPTTYANPDRGPPADYDADSRPAGDLVSRGASARTQLAPALGYATYDDPAPLVQFAQTATTTPEQALDDDGTLSAFVRGGVAAKSESALIKAGKTCLNSFTGDTPVLMADGTKKPIKDVELGDKVMATDPETGKTGPRRVVDLIRHSGPHTMVAVRLADGTAIDATDQHPFWVENRDEWVDAIDLVAGDRVVTADGHLLEVVALGISTADLTAYNLTIAGLHTYFAGTDSVLVHNSGGMGGCSDAAYQGVLHLRDEIAKEGSGGVHSWAAKMSDDALADYLDGFVTRGGGQALKGGGVGWFDAERGIGIIQRNEYSMTGYSMSYETFLGKLR